MVRNLTASILTIAGDSVQFGHISYNAPMPKQTDHEHSHGLMVETGKPEVARPPLYSVLLLNGELIASGSVAEAFTDANIQRAYSTRVFSGPDAHGHNHGHDHDSDHDHPSA